MSRAKVLTLGGIGLALALSIAVAVVFVLGQSSEPPGRAPEPRVEQAPAPAPTSVRDEIHGERSTVPAGEEEPAPLPVLSVHGRVVDAAGAPVPEIEVGIVVEDGEAPVRARSDASGSFRLDATSLPCAIEVTDPGWTTLRQGEVDPDAPLVPAIVIAARATSVNGIVVDPAGRPLAGARLMIRPEKGGPGDLRGAWDAESAENGTFSFVRAPAIARARLSTRLAEFATDERTLDLPPAEPLRIVLTPAPAEGPILTGTVTRADGSPEPGAAVSFGSARTRSDIHGRFRLVAGWFDATTPLVAAARRSSPAILAGYGARVDPEARELPPETLVLPGIALSIAGRVSLSDGSPAKGWRVALVDGTPLDPGGASADVVEGLAGHRIDLRTDARGGFEFGGLADRPYTIVAFGRDRSSRVEVLVRSPPVAAGSREVVLEAPDGRPGAAIAGRVLTPTGAPVAGARIGLGRAAPRGSGSEFGMQGHHRTVSDADGRFEIPGVPAGFAYLVVVDERFLPLRMPLEDDAARAEVAVRLRLRRELSFDGSGSSPQPDLLRAIAGGTPAPVWRLGGATARPAPLLRLDGGQSGPIAVGDDVRSIVLYRGCRELGRAALVLGDEGPTRVVWP